MQDAHIFPKGLTNIVSPFFACYDTVTDREGAGRMRKLIVFDIDGTLRDETQGVPGSIPFVLEELKRRGHETAICTGRSMGMIQDDVLNLGVENLITGGGSYISHRGIPVFETELDREAVGRVRQYLAEQCEEDMGAVLESQEEIYMNQTAADILNSMNREKSKTLTPEQRELFLKNEKIEYRNNLAAFRPGEVKVHKICMWCSPAAYRHILKILGAGRTELAQQGTWKEYGYYEMIGRGMGKGAAVLRLCELLGIRRQDTIAFGDGRNDIEMLKCCGTGIAMENGAKELFPFADRICARPMEHGIYWELLRSGLIGAKAASQTDMSACKFGGCPL